MKHSKEDWDSVGGSVNFSVEDSVWVSVSNSVYFAVGNFVWGSVRNPVEEKFNETS